MTINRHSWTSATFGANVTGSEYIERTFVKALRAKLVVAPLGRQSTMPEHQSNTVRWQFFSNPTAAASITEGADPTTGTDFTTTTAEVDLWEYGNYAEYSEYLEMVSVPATMEELAMGEAYEAALTVDTRCTTVLNAGMTSTTDVGTALTAEDLRARAQALHANSAEYHPSTPGYFAYVTNSNGWFDMAGEGAPAWFQAKDVRVQSAMDKPGSGGSANTIWDCQAILTENIPTGSGNDITFLLAKDAFGVAALRTDVMRPRLIMTSPEQLVSAPIRNRGTIGWKAFFNAVAIDANRGEEIQYDT
jgi:N4-gp56 family major capsid protein